MSVRVCTRKYSLIVCFRFSMCTVLITTNSNRITVLTLSIPIAQYDGRYQSVRDITTHVVQRNYFSIFTRCSLRNISKYLEKTWNVYCILVHVGTLITINSMDNIPVCIRLKHVFRACIHDLVANTKERRNSSSKFSRKIRKRSFRKFLENIEDIFLKCLESSFCHLFTLCQYVCST